MANGLQHHNQVALVVRLVIRGQVVAVAHTDEICSETMGIQNPGLELNAGEIVTVGFIKPGHPRPISYTTTARVVYSNSKIIGLEFDNDISIPAVVSRKDIETRESPMRQVS